nr:23S rRNA (pseudouridine(1915)-N(3))-methyltransferase RlmH [Bacteroidota bacterium]
MQLKLICVAKKSENVYSELCNEYWKRLQNYGVKCELKVLENKAVTQNINHNKESENGLIIKELGANDFVVALDETGQQLHSIAFANMLQTTMNKTSKITFVIGGAYGLNEETRKRANAVISLSALTFPHQMVRLILAEQLYRAFSILRNEKYHH